VFEILLFGHMLANVQSKLEADDHHISSWLALERVS